MHTETSFADNNYASTSSDAVAPVLVTVAATVTFWPALTVDGAISRSEYLKVVYDLKAC